LKKSFAQKKEEEQQVKQQPEPEKEIKIVFSEQEVKPIEEVKPVEESKVSDLELDLDWEVIKKEEFVSSVPIPVPVPSIPVIPIAAPVVASASVVSSNERSLEAELKILNDMGFMDNEVNKALLAAENYDINSVVSFLLQN